MNSSTWLQPLLMTLSALGGPGLAAIFLRRARLIEDTPSSRIRSAPQGYVELSGFARNDPDTPITASAKSIAATDTLRAPLTHTPCVWYRYRIEREEHGSKGSQWETVESGSSEHWFVLDDRSGFCHVDPRGADVTPNTRQVWKGTSQRPLNSGAPHTSPLAALFDNLPFSIGLGEREYRYTEWRIHTGEWLYALGEFKTVHAPSSEQRTQEQMKNLLNDWKQNRDELLARFDRNGDGEIDLQEWEDARREAERTARAQVLQTVGAPPLNVLTRPTNRQQPYLIAATDPEQLARRLRWKAFASLIIGLGLAAFLAHLQFTRHF